MKRERAPMKEHDTCFQLLNRLRIFPGYSLTPERSHTQLGKPHLYPRCSPRRRKCDVGEGRSQSKAEVVRSLVPSTGTINATLPPSRHPCLGRYFSSCASEESARSHTQIPCSTPDQVKHGLSGQTQRLNSEQTPC